MVNPRLRVILEQRYPSDIVHHIVTSFWEVEQNFRLEKWKTSELDAGHFVEAVRRLIEHELNGSHTPFSTALGSFNQPALNQYESKQGAEEFRILIPRLIYAMYCIRNKRGVGHISEISPNKLDATIILHSAKWVLAELLRLAGSSTPDEAKILVDQILYRQLDIIWDDGETFMVLDHKLKAAEKVLVVLYRQDRLPIEDLRMKVEYKNKSLFRKMLTDLQNKKLISVTANGLCKLSPIGARQVEESLKT